MTQTPEAIGPLKTVTLSLLAGTAPDLTDLTPEPRTLEFVFGIGKDGFVPFEYDIVNRTTGESAVVCVQRGEATTYFEHLACRVLPMVPDIDRFYLQVRVEQVRPTDSRAVIRALAERTQCEGDCGCGCGGH